MSDAAPKPRVVVLLSTYNGERFVVEQLQSILSQLPPGGRILIRDDGSPDGTASTIEALAEPRITLTRGANLGFGKSFLTLLAQAPGDADMVMFADQDDVWLPDKIERAWQWLAPKADRPALYGSAQMLVDAQLRPLHPTPPWPMGPSFSNALTENVITGCTAALNRPAVELLQRAGVPEGVLFHDWWLYLVVSAFGDVLFDDRPTLLYRQHEGNLIGHGAGWWGRNARILRFLVRNDWVGILLRQVGALFRHYGDQLSPTAREMILRRFDVQASRPVPRWQMILSSERLRQWPASELTLRVLLLLHRIHVWPLPGKRL